MDNAFEKQGICIFLDDARDAPEGWIRAYWPNEVIRLLESETVSIVSLDHDLGDDARGTGYDVIKWIENKTYHENYKPPEIRIHSANSSAIIKMELGVKSIDNIYMNKQKNQMQDS